jgi:hypothetical protein
MAFTENLDAFLNIDDFAITAAFTPRGGSTAVDIIGIFDNEYLVVNENEYGGIAATNPMFTTKTANVANARGGTLVVDSVTYDITEDKPDGQGMTILILDNQ